MARLLNPPLYLLVVVLAAIPVTGAYVELGAGPADEFVLDLSFSPNGTTLVQARKDGWVETWNLNNSTWELGSRFQGHSGWARSSAFHPSGALVATGGDGGEVIVWNTSSWGVERNDSVHGSIVRSIAFSADGALMVTGGDDHTFRLRSTQDWSFLFNSSDLGHNVLAVGLAPNSSQLAAAHGPDLELFEVGSLSYLPSITAAANILDLEFHPGGGYIATGLQNGEVQVWSTANLSLVANLTPVSGLAVESITWSADGSHLYSSSWNETAVFAEGTWARIANISRPECLSYGLEVSPGGGHLGAGCGGDVLVWELDDDGDGVPNLEDDCPQEAGNSTFDVVGCPDSDGDSWSDNGDAFPNDPTEWEDPDGDGIGSNSDDCPLTWGNATDAPGCPDLDGDGYSDGTDHFPGDPTEWWDSDSDGFGDNSDPCPLEPGPSGCPEDPPNDTNGTGNNTNGTGNHTGGNETGNGTNGTGNETNPNGTGNETIPDPGDNNTNSTGNGTNSTTPDPDPEPDPTDEPGTNETVDHGADPGPDGSGLDPQVLGIAAAGAAALLGLAGIGTLLLKRKEGGPDSPAVLPPHPTLVVDELEELEWLDMGDEDEPIVIDLDKFAATPSVPNYIAPGERDYEGELDQIWSRVQPGVDEINHDLIKEVDRVEKEVRHTRDLGDMAPRRFEKLLQRCRDMRAHLQATSPIFRRSA